MSKHSKQSEPETTETAPAGHPGPTGATGPLGPDGATATGGDLAAAANLKPTADGQPDPAAQAKLSATAGARSSGDLLAELGALPNVAALDGIKANAQAGYYKGKAEDLAKDLEGVSFEDEQHGKVRDALVERARSGSFSAK